MAGVIVLTLFVALAGIIQKAVSPDAVYGFKKVDGASPFGPFINRNHFAGWMLMAVPVALGYFCANASRAMAGVKAHWRARVRWLSTPAATQVILLAVGILVIALSLVLTSSRSGVACFAVALIAAIGFVTRAEARRSSRRLAVGYLLLVAAITVGWAGADTVAARFGQLEGSRFGGRLPIWRDTLRIVRDFPLAGTGLNTYRSAMFLDETPNAEWEVAPGAQRLPAAAVRGRRAGGAARAGARHPAGRPLRARSPRDPCGPDGLLDSGGGGHRCAGDRSPGNRRVQPAGSRNRRAVRRAVCDGGAPEHGCQVHSRSST